MKSLRRGLGLLEMVICGGLLVLAIALCSELALSGIRTRQAGMSQNSAFRQTTSVLSLLQQDLRQSRRFYQPDLNTLQPYQPGSPSPPLIFSTTAINGTLQVVSWTWINKELSRTLYRADFNPSDPGSQFPLNNQRSQKTKVDRFLIQLEPPGSHFGNKILRTEIDFGAPNHQKIVASQQLDS